MQKLSARIMAACLLFVVMLGIGTMIIRKEGKGQ
jgi:hypothetical protein